jgi:hypothetical protein
LLCNSTGELSRSEVVIPGEFFTSPTSPLQGVGCEQTDLQLVGEFALLAERTSEDIANTEGRVPRVITPSSSESGSQGRSSTSGRTNSSEFVLDASRKSVILEHGRQSLNLGAAGSRKSRANLGPIFLSSLSAPSSALHPATSSSPSTNSLDSM